MTACSDDDDTTIVNNITNRFPQGNVLVSQNGPGNAGTVSVQGAINDVTGSAQPTMVLNTGGNEGLAVDLLGNIIQNNDQNGADTIQLFSEFAQRANNASFNSSIDGQINPAINGAMKGSAYVPSRNLWLAAVFNGRTSAGSIAGVSLASRGTSTAPVTPAFSTATFSGGNVSGTVTNTSPWDLVYDAASDRLFVAVTDGSVAVYDAFFANGPNNATATRFLQFGAFNAHGIVYNAATDTLVVTDVGSVTTGVNTDGRIFVITGAGAITGTGTVQVTPSVNIAGSLTGLGNPVDIDFDGTNLVIAEKSLDTLLVPGTIPNLVSGNIPPRSSVSNSKPESVAIFNTSLNELVQANDLRNAASVAALVVVQNPGDVGMTGENMVVAFNPTTLASTGTAFNMSGVGPTSIENIAFANNGTAFMTFGNDSGAVTNTVGIGGIARVAYASNPFLQSNVLQRVPRRCWFNRK